MLSYPDTNRINGFKELEHTVESLGLDKGKIIIGGSAAMAAYGILGHNNDIDIGIDDAYRQELIKEGIIKIRPENGKMHYMLGDTNLDCGVVGSPPELNKHEDTANAGGGWLVETPPALLRFYKRLCVHFSDDGAKKQKYAARVAQLQAALA